MADTKETNVNISEKELTLEELEQMIENANEQGLMMCMTDAEVNDVD